MGCEGLPRQSSARFGARFGEQCIECCALRRGKKFGASRLSDSFAFRHCLIPILSMQATEDADNFKTIIVHSAQGIALTEALVPRTAEDRMIGNLVLDAELAKNL